MRCLIVTGRFDEDGGRPSKVGQTISSAVVLNKLQYKEIRVCNGGNLNKIKTLVKESMWYNVILWFPDVVTADETKWINDIKAQNKTCVLVTSKNNMAQKYSLPDLIQKALRQRANLFMEIQKREDEGRVVFVARVLDPLGNMFLDWTEDFTVVADAIISRVDELRGYTRKASYPTYSGPVLVPDEEEFFELVRKSAVKFNTLIPGATNVERFIGNASFRSDDLVYITKRNIDKTAINEKGFVAVNAGSEEVMYFDVHKPSVDTPIHLRLYKMYPEINYILHGHVYLQHITMTKEVIPCGSLEEADEIFKHYSHSNYISFRLNLKGHGFIALTNNVSGMYHMITNLVPRPMPELVRE